VRWYRLSAEKGDADGQAALGMAYEVGQGIPQDYNEAVKWSRLAAERGNSTA
jgi:TPR repeat protein